MDGNQTETSLTLYHQLLTHSTEIDQNNNANSDTLQILREKNYL